MDAGARVNDNLDNLANCAKQNRPALRPGGLYLLSFGPYLRLPLPMRRSMNRNRLMKSR